jgi:hypothetical protein
MSVGLPARWWVHRDEDGSCCLQIELGAACAVLLTALVEDGNSTTLWRAHEVHDFEGSPADFRA